MTLDGPSGAKGCLSRTDVDHLVKKWKSGEAYPPASSIKNTEKELTSILLMEAGYSEFEKKITIEFLPNTKL